MPKAQYQYPQVGKGVPKIHGSSFCFPEQTGGDTFLHFLCPFPFPFSPLVTMVSSCSCSPYHQADPHSVPLPYTSSAREVVLVHCETGLCLFCHHCFRCFQLPHLPPSPTHSLVSAQVDESLRCLGRLYRGTFFFFQLWMSI